MDKSFGYLVDLADVKLDEATSSTWIQAMPFGKWDHPLYGEIAFTPENGKQYADNINNGIRGQDLNIDYDHKEGDAAGWVKKAEVRSDGVWWKVDWTPTAFQKLKEKAYRYFSPEFKDEWKNPKTSLVHQNVAFGGAITNRPFLKGILPINLSEFFSEQGPTGNEGGKVKPETIKKWATQLGLGEDATEEQVLAKMEAEDLDISEAPSETDPPANEPPKPESDELKAAKETLEQAKKLAESNANIAPLVQLYETTVKRLEEMEKRTLISEAATRLTEVDNAVKTLSEKAHSAKGGGFALPIPLREKIAKTLNEAPKALGDSVIELFSELLDARLVRLGEIGSIRTASGDVKQSAYAEATDRAKKLTEENKSLTLNDAMGQVFDRDPELYERYRGESYTKEAGS